MISPKTIESMYDEMSKEAVSLDTLRAIAGGVGQHLNRSSGNIGAGMGLGAVGGGLIGGVRGAHSMDIVVRWVPSADFLDSEKALFLGRRWVALRAWLPAGMGRIL